jgi:hypothetical protein
MTLRHDIHSAIDEIAPPTPALARQVFASLAPAGKSARPPAQRGSRNPWLTGLGRTGSLVAAILVVLLIVTVVVGVRVWRDRDALNPVPADQRELARLQARPLILPSVLPGAECPANFQASTVYYYDGHSVTPQPGGPMALAGQGLQAISKWGDYYDPTYSIERKVNKGLVLIRIRDLRTGQVGVFVGPSAAGDVVGTDTVDGKVVDQYAYAVLDLSHPPADANKDFASWTVRQGWAAGWSGCVGFQLDGPDFSQVFAGATTPSPR